MLGFAWVATDSPCSLVRRMVRFGCSCPESAPHLGKCRSSGSASTPGAAGKARGATEVTQARGYLQLPGTGTAVTPHKEQVPHSARVPVCQTFPRQLEACQGSRQPLPQSTGTLPAQPRAFPQDTQPPARLTGALKSLFKQWQCRPSS